MYRASIPKNRLLLGSLQLSLNALIFSLHNDDGLNILIISGGLGVTWESLPDRPTRKLRP